MKVKLKVYRFNPQKDEKPHFEDYELELRDDAVLLDALNEIKWRFDGSLSYRRSCRHGICGSCAVKLNGKNVLACKTPLKDAIKNFGEELIIEPLTKNKEKIVKDLVVEKKIFGKKIIK